ncbi:MAG: hydrogenase nickel incorporation protein HypB [Lachnospiraceae bacterium]|nr:hydrogenase nickel incorporation protein HypB [Lachnospiraceae bacterium]
MDEVRIIEVKQSVLADNDKDADALRKKMKDDKTFLINLMAGPGAGKTTTLVRVINMMKQKYKIGVLEADIDSDVDAVTIAGATGVDAVQLHTGGMCHLDAEMTRQGVNELEKEYGHHDIVILENVGNLVCPAEFDTGAAMNMMILSVPEGDDKPLKYPLMFQVCNLAVINKTDVMPYFDFDMEKCREGIARRNPNAAVIPISAKTGDGIDELVEYLNCKVEEWRK